MPDLNYQLLKRTLNFHVAVKWLVRDAIDDFYPDPVNFADLKLYPAEYLDRRQHRLLQTSTLPHLMEYKPKKGGMLREAIWLCPASRVLYLAILHHLLPRLDSKVFDEVYSYRRDEPHDPDAYPFEERMNRWKQCQNDFREAALEASTGAVLVTDIASFFDHISCDEMCRRIRGMLGATAHAEDEAVINLLSTLLNMWSTDGFGIPQNHDPSSFFGSLYLHNVDHELVSRRFRYFRWLDDIRIVAKSKEQALRALHELQRALAPYRLFLSTAKTCILTKGDPRLGALLDVEDDEALSRADEIKMTGDCGNMKAFINKLFARLEHHAGPEGDDRKFRAFANRLLDFGDYSEIRQEIHPRLQEFVIPRLDTHPEQSDTWVKILSAYQDGNAIAAAEQRLAERPSVFDWQRFHLWKLATNAPGPLPEKLLDQAILVSRSGVSHAETAQAIVCVGRHGDNTQREGLFRSSFTAQRSQLVQRAVLIAIQALPREQRDYLFRRALEINPDHRELVDYLSSLESPNYGEKKRPERRCKEVPRKVETRIRRGIGLVGGKVVRFRLTQQDSDYE